MATPGATPPAGTANLSAKDAEGLLVKGQLEKEQAMREKASTVDDSDDSHKLGSQKLTVNDREISVVDNEEYGAPLEDRGPQKSRTETRPGGAFWRGQYLVNANNEVIGVSKSFAEKRDKSEPIPMKAVIPSDKADAS